MKELERSFKGFKGVDFDGTLVRDDVPEANVPIMPMVERIRKWLAEGEDVIIFTARGWQQGVEDFCVEHFGRALPITNIKLRGLSEWYDDRCIAVEPNTGRILDTAALVEENKLLKRKLTYLTSLLKIHKEMVS
jgi:hypothetical protein